MRTGGDNGRSTAALSRGGGRGGGDGGGGLGRSGGESIDDPFPSPCIITFGGSALRAGGGYAHAVLHALEPLPLDWKENGGESVEGSAGGGGERGRVGGARKMSSSVGVFGGLEAPSTDARRLSLNKFQT